MPAMLVSVESTAATSEQMTYMATLAQVLPVLILGVALESRVIQLTGGAIAGSLVVLGVFGEMFALLWLAGIAYEGDNPLVVEALPTFRFVAESSCFLLLALFNFFAISAVFKMRRRPSTNHHDESDAT
jgi:hypothetical protein